MLNLKVNSKDIFIDDEDLHLGILCELDCLEWKYGLPKWAYLPIEWSEYITKKVYLQKKLRKLQERLGYSNNCN